jgi:hypothetical protein
MWLQSGKSITPIEALNEFNCFRLAAHIEVLRRDGHRIFTHMVDENGKKFARYTLN